MKKLTVPAAMEHFGEMNDFVRRQAQEAGFDAVTVNKILLAAEEILVNVIRYAYPGGAGDLTIACTFTGGNNELSIDIADSGIEFNPLLAAPPDTSLPVEERPIGGLGIFIVRKIMDEVRYRRENGRNVLTMIKRRGSSPEGA